MASEKNPFPEDLSVPWLGKHSGKFILVDIVPSPSHPGYVDYKMTHATAGWEDSTIQPIPEAMARDEIDWILDRVGLESTDLVWSRKEVA